MLGGVVLKGHACLSARFRERRTLPVARGLAAWVAESPRQMPYTKCLPHACSTA